MDVMCGTYPPDLALNATRDNPQTRFWRISWTKNVHEIRQNEERDGLQLERLDLEELLEAERAQLAAVAGLLEAAERRHRVEAAAVDGKVRATRKRNCSPIRASIRGVGNVAGSSAAPTREVTADLERSRPRCDDSATENDGEGDGSEAQMTGLLLVITSCAGVRLTGRLVSCL